MRITINGGHYPSKDSGATGATITEAEYTSKLMPAVAEYLEKVGYTVQQVQEDDLHEITQKSNAWQSDLFVSLHCNACFSHNARGTETFSYYDSVKGKKLAECIQAQLIKAIHTKDRGAKEAGFYVLKYTKAPAVLVEVAFIDNIEDEKILIDRFDDIAKAIARGITDYVQGA